MEREARPAVGLCANLLHSRVGHRLNIAPPPGKPISEAIDEALAAAEAEVANGLLVAPSVRATLKRKNAAPDMGLYRGVQPLVKEHWGWGMMLQQGAA